LPTHTDCVDINRVGGIMKFHIILFLLVIMSFGAGCSSRKVPTVNIEGVNQRSFMEAVAQPIYSVNLMKKEIPQNLRDLTVVYQPPENCEAFSQELSLLNAALGEDLTDKPSDKGDTFTLNLGQMLSDEVESNIPFNSLVKRLSGARKHEKARLSAQVRGRARRSYINGWAHGRGCQEDLALEELYEEQDQRATEIKSNL